MAGFSHPLHLGVFKIMLNTFDLMWSDSTSYNLVLVHGVLEAEMDENKRKACEKRTREKRICGENEQKVGIVNTEREKEGERSNLFL